MERRLRLARHHVVGRERGGGHQQPLEVELRDGRERREILERGRVDHLHQRALAVEQAQDPVQLVRDLVQPLQQLLAVDLEDGRERRQRLEQAAPLVDAAHALHEEALRRRLDPVGVVDLAELDLERPLVPQERAVDGLLAAEPAERRVDDLALAEVDLRLVVRVRQVDDPALPAHLERLQQIHDVHVEDRPGEPGPPRRREVARRDPLARPPREEQRHARDELAHEDRLGQVVLDAELQPADLVLDGPLAREEDDRDRGPVGVLLHLADEGISVHVGEARVAEDEVRRGDLELRESVRSVLRGGHAVTGLFQADLEDPNAARIRVDQEELLLGH
nr:hypothetical protein [Sorangium cellulosum]